MSEINPSFTCLVLADGREVVADEIEASGNSKGILIWVRNPREAIPRRARWQIVILDEETEEEYVIADFEGYVRRSFGFVVVVTS